MDSCSKILEYLKKVSKHPITVNNHVLLPYAPDEVILSQSFFFKDNCVMCGKCCPNETTVWTQEGMNRIKCATPRDFSKWELEYSVIDEIMQRVVTEVVNINGIDVEFFVSAKDKDKDAYKVAWSDRKQCNRCHWLFEKDSTYRCRLHPVRSVTCGLPHCRFFYNAKSNRTSIGVSQYGRNWALKCPVDFEQFVDEQSIESRLLWLKRLNAVADDCRLETYLPEIIDYVQQGGRVERVFKSSCNKLFQTR